MQAARQLKHLIHSRALHYIHYLREGIGHFERIKLTKGIPGYNERDLANKNDNGPGNRAKSILTSLPLYLIPKKPKMAYQKQQLQRMFKSLQQECADTVQFRCAEGGATQRQE